VRQLHLDWRMTHCSLRSVRGFTLVEALVAAALLALAVVALAHVAALGTRQAVRNRHLLAAIAAAQGKLERLRAVTWSYTDPDGGLTPSPPRSLFEDVAGLVENVGGFVVRWAIVPLETADENTVVLQVCAFASRHVPQRPEACVSTIRTRRP
jgi:hypothetical protein